VAPNGPMQCKRCHRFGHTQYNYDYAPRCVACGGSYLTGECQAPRGQPQGCSCRGRNTANYRGCVKWREAKASLAKRAPARVKAESATATLKPRRAGPTEEQVDLGEGCSHVAEGVLLGLISNPPNTHLNKYLSHIKLL
jgi:hypothetical protein